MTTQDAAWAAGLFEGEGSICFAPRSRGGFVRTLSLEMSDKDVVERFAATVQCGGIWVRQPRKNRLGKKTHYVWYCGKWSDVVAVLTQFLPWLGERRRSAAERLLANPPALDPRTICVRGHPLDGPGSDIKTWSGRRHCQHCRRMRQTPSTALLQ